MKTTAIAQQTLESVPITIRPTVASKARAYAIFYAKKSVSLHLVKAAIKTVTSTPN